MSNELSILATDCQSRAIALVASLRESEETSLPGFISLETSNWPVLNPNYRPDYTLKTFTSDQISGEYKSVAVKNIAVNWKQSVLATTGGVGLAGVTVATAGGYLPLAGVFFAIWFVGSLRTVPVSENVAILLHSAWHELGDAQWLEKERMSVANDKYRSRLGLPALSESKFEQAFLTLLKLRAAKMNEHAKVVLLEQTQIPL